MGFCGLVKKATRLIFSIQSSLSCRLDASRMKTRAKKRDLIWKRKFRLSLIGKSFGLATGLASQLARWMHPTGVLFCFFFFFSIRVGSRRRGKREEERGKGEGVEHLGTLKVRKDTDAPQTKVPVLP